MNNSGCPPIVHFWARIATELAFISVLFGLGWWHEIEYCLKLALDLLMLFVFEIRTIIEIKSKCKSLTTVKIVMAEIYLLMGLCMVLS